MESLAQKMRVHLRRDECGDRTVTGKRGNIHRGTKGGVSGYYVSLMYSSARKFHIELDKCSMLGEITAEGDTEAVLFIPRATALENARLIRSAIHARRIKQLSPETRATLAVRLRDLREIAYSGAVQSAGLIFTGKQVPTQEAAVR